MRLAAPLLFAVIFLGFAMYHGARDMDGKMRRRRRAAAAVEMTKGFSSEFSLVSTADDDDDEDDGHLEFV